MVEWAYVASKRQLMCKQFKTVTSKLSRNVKISPPNAAIAAASTSATQPDVPVSKCSPLTAKKK